MLTFTGTDASRAVIDYWGAHSSELPEQIHSTLAAALGELDPLGRIISTMEALYAARADLGEPGLELLDGLARFVGANNFYGKGTRAAIIAGVTARIAGGGAPMIEGDPEIEPQFAEPQESEAEADQEPEADTNTDVDVDE